MIRKIQRVQKVLNDAVLHTGKFQSKSKISCPSGCFQCCTKKDISASPLEFLPLAYFLYKNNRADEVYEQLSELESESVCILLKPMGIDGGGCSEYAFRGLVCRLFGYAAGTDKFQQRRLITCKILKESPEYSLLTPKVLGSAPQFPDYYMRLAAIDFQLANEQYPINTAIKRAIEIVLTYYMYRGRKRRA